MRPRDTALAVLVAACWGLNFVIIEVGLRDVPPLVLSAARFTLAAFPLVFFLRRPQIAWRWILGVGVALGVVKFGLLFVGMDVGAPAGLASLVLQVQAPFTVVLAALVLGERPAGRRLLGVAVACSGVGLLVAGRGGSATTLGLCLVIAAGAAWAVANLVIRRAQAPDPLALIVWSSLIPPLPLLALAVASDGPGGTLDGISALITSPAALGSVLYITVVATLFGFGTWSRLLKSYDAGRVAPFALLVPPFGMGFAALLLGESVTPLAALAAAVVLAGVALTLGSPAPADDRVPAPRPGPGAGLPAPAALAARRAA